ncbi:hypothetical protein SDC9_120029 [bioreactor metagenome]|uniref:Uncharacterized protein n=1 Tax=bioreactor metagenome TaxID=1076179 RepID=A0A645C918_9ZZZZ
MSETGHAARLADERNTFLGGEPLARNIGGGPPREVLREGLRHAAHIAFIYQKPRYMRTRDHLSARNFPHLFDGDAKAERAELFAHHEVARVAPSADIIKPAFQPARARRYPVAQYMEREGGLSRQLNAAEPLDPLFGAGPHERPQPGGRVMIGKREQRKSAPPRRRHELLRRESTVGITAVHMHINQDHLHRPPLRRLRKTQTYRARGR